MEDILVRDRKWHIHNFIANVVSCIYIAVPSELSQASQNHQEIAFKEGAFCE